MLFESLVFGPIRSRRLGLSLGIHLLPGEGKFCNYDCVYCECGWNSDHPVNGLGLPKREAIREALENKLKAMQAEGELPNSLTFAGNGEPTLHPDFYAIVKDCIELRNQYAPKAEVSVLSNATMLHKAEVVEALNMVDKPILKLDSGIERTRDYINQGARQYTNEEWLKLMKPIQNAWIQTLFFKGELEGNIKIDNTTEEEVEAWIAYIQALQPKGVMLYSLDRATPARGLQKMDKAVLEDIGARLQAQVKGIEVGVFG